MNLIPFPPGRALAPTTVFRKSSKGWAFGLKKIIFAHLGACASQYISGVIWQCEEGLESYSITRYKK